jgi:tetratricopeptide (TPR) repeat protein
MVLLLTLSLLAPPLLAAAPPADVRRAATVLHADVGLVSEAHDAIDQVYRGQYDAALQSFAAMESRYPGTGFHSAGRALVWQGRMLADDDFRWDDEYQVDYAAARAQLETAVGVPGNDALDHFLLGGVLGLDALHLARKSEHLASMNRGMESMSALRRCQELAPEFIDAKIGDGLFMYWTTVISRRSKLIPDSPDQRTLGIRQLESIAQNALLLRPGAQLALTYIWLEEGSEKMALQTAIANHFDYPDSVISELALGRVYELNGLDDAARKVYLNVRRLDPKNRLVYLYLGNFYTRQDQHERALTTYDRYLGFGLTSEQAAVAHYNKGEVYFRMKDWDRADAAFAKAWDLDRVDGAKQRRRDVAEAR